MGSRAPEGPNSVAAISGFALGMACALAVSTLKQVARAYPSKPPIKGAWIGYVIAAAIAALPFVPRLRRIPYVMLGVSAIVPVIVSSAIAEHYGFTSDVGFKFRSVGTLVSFALIFLSALYFLRQNKELDRQIYTQSALVAFFAMVGVGVVYGVAEDSFGAPHLPLTLLSLAGLAVFVASLFVLEKRYS
jgi:hypothetical protein